MTSPSPSEPTETPKGDKCKHGVPLDNPCFDCDDHPIPIIPPPELQRTGEAKRGAVCLTPEQRGALKPFRDSLKKHFEAAVTLGEMSADCDIEYILDVTEAVAADELSTDYEAREAQLRADKLKVNQLEWLWANCRIIYHPDGLGTYPIEHMIYGMFKKDTRWMIEMEMPAHLQPPEDNATPAMKTPEQD
jgi:hypothetical protein